MQVNGSTIGAVASGRADQRFEVALNHWSWKKLFNLLRIELQLRLGNTRVGGIPYEWEIDTTNICQFKCPLCDTGLGNIKRQNGVMHLDTFKKVVDQIKDYCVWLSLYSWGEPFLNKDIDKYVAYAHDADIATIISSNLNKPLTPEMAERLIRSGLDVLIISLDGTTQEVYEVYRVGGVLERVLANVRLLVEKRKELGYSTPHFEWQFIVMRQNEDQIPEARRMAKELGVDDIIFKKVDFPFGANDMEAAKRWLPSGANAARSERPLDMAYEEYGERCWRLWRSAVVNWDGGYAPCCYLTDASDDFGDVNTHTIKEIWNNQRYHTARGLFKNGNGGAPSMRVGCLDCSVYQGSKAAKSRERPTSGSRAGSLTAALRTLHVDLAPPKWGIFKHLREVLLLVGAYFAYMVVRRFVLPGVEAEAFANAMKVISFETAAGIFWEPQLQDLAVKSSRTLVVFFNWAYIFTFFPVILTTAVIVYLKDRPKYLYYRNLVLLSFVFALIIFVVFPLAPPRFSPEHGFIDAIQRFGPT